MKKSLIFQIGVKGLLPLLLLISVIIFWRGHQLPGGGFIGGLVGGASLAAHAYAYGASATLCLIRIHPLTLVASGLVAALLSGIIGLFLGAGPFKGLWVSVPLLGVLGTPVLFDLGVYLLVVGFVLVFITQTSEEKS